MIAWPEEVIDDIARRRCVLFLGSGVSMNSVNDSGRRPKTWKSFLESALEGVSPNKHIKKLLKENDFLTACELIKRQMDRSNFTRLVRNEFLTPAYKFAPIHEEIFKLDSRLVVTPNFDKIYETYANSQANGSIVVKHHYDADVNSVIRETGRVILKIHGTIDSPDNMIFTRSEYAEARSRYRTFYEILEALSLTHTFIFIGSGVNDPDIRLLLEDTFFKHKSARPHIMILPNKSVHETIIDVIEDTMNLKILRYSPNNNHQELLESIKHLVEIVDSQRNEIRTSGNW